LAAVQKAIYRPISLLAVVQKAIYRTISLLAVVQKAIYRPISLLAVVQKAIYRPISLLADALCVILYLETVKVGPCLSVSCKYRSDILCDFNVSLQPFLY
jgi:hypothetical protein